MLSEGTNLEVPISHNTGDVCAASALLFGLKFVSRSWEEELWQHTDAQGLKL